jgi:hypothetical protein
MAPKPSMARLKSGENSDQRSAERIIAEHEMTKHVVRLPDPDGSLLLRELNHRINNELTSAICTVTVKAMESDNVAVKAALSTSWTSWTNAPMFIARCTCRIGNASPMSRSTSSSFASP